MPSCQAPSCLTAISTEVEKSPHSILLAESDKKHMPNCQGLWRNDLHFLTAPFLCRYFCKWQQAARPHCHLERSCLSVSGEMVLGSMKILSREISHHHGASSLRIAISPLLGAFAEMKRKRRESLCQFISCQLRMEHLLFDCLTIWKGLHHFFTAPAYRGKGAATLWDLWTRAAEQSRNLKSVILIQLKVKSNFFNSTFWVKKLSQTNSINSGVLTCE